jgi:hypothetical protein
MATSNQYGNYPNACVFSIPIVLQIPIQLQPEVSAAPPVCVMQNGYSKQQLPASTPQPTY